ncbi:MAG TPA: hypothetical protein VGG71_07305, partial [Chitinophagaceae bacterium]
MDFDNKHEEKRDWREQRRKWKEERRQRWMDRRNYGTERWGEHYQARNSGVWTGIFLLLIGLDYFLVENNILPHWMRGWGIFLIGFGLFIGIRHNFRNPTWFILTVAGGVVLVRSDEFIKYFPGINVNHIWPLALIILGLFFIFRPHRRNRYWQEHVNDKGDAKINETSSQSPQST